MARIEVQEDQTGASATDDGGLRIDWADLLTIAHRRWRIVAAVAVVGAVLSSLLALLPSPTYRAAAKIMVTADRGRIKLSPDPSDSSSGERFTDQDLNSEAAILSSPSAIRAVLEKSDGTDGSRPNQDEAPAGSSLADIIDGVRHPLDGLAELYERAHGVTPLSPLERRVRKVADFTQVTVVPRTNLIEVAYESSDPVRAAEFVNALVSQHVDRHTRMFRQEQALEFMGSQRELLSERLRAAEGALQEFGEREGVDSVPTARAAQAEQLHELETAMATADRELAENRARAEFLTKAVRELPKEVTAPPAAGAGGNDGRGLVRSRLLDLQLQRSQLLAQFAPTSIKVRDIDRQIADAEALLASERNAAGAGANPAYQALATELTQTGAQVAALTARIEALRAQLTTSRAIVAHLDEIGPEFERLDQEAATARTAFLNYQKKEEQARFSAALDQSRIVNVAIVEPAEVPSAPLPSRAAMTFIAGTLLSLAAGFGLAYLRDRFDPSVKGAADATKITGLPVIAHIAS